MDSKSLDAIHRRLTATAAVALALSGEPFLAKPAPYDQLVESGRDWGITVDEAEEFLETVAGRLGDLGYTGIMSYHGCLFSIVAHDIAHEKKAVVEFMGRDADWCGIEHFGIEIGNIIQRSGLAAATPAEVLSLFERQMDAGNPVAVMVGDRGRDG